MKHLVIMIFLFLICSGAYSEECVFTGTVEPFEKTETVKELYRKACLFFTNTFDARLNPEIRLSGVRYEEGWSQGTLDIILRKDGHKDVYAFFHDGTNPLVNEIYVNLKGYGRIFSENEVSENSVLFHEMIHFFFKAANLEYLTKNGIERNQLMEEVLSYWCQNQYVKEVTEGKKDLMDYVHGGGEGFGIIDTDAFINLAFTIYSMVQEGFVFQSVRFLDDDPKGKYNRIVNNQYVTDQ